MKHLIFTVYDEKAKAFLTPFFLPEKGMAVRVFSDCVNSDDHQFGKHPHDYTLFCIGEWLDHDGVIVAEQKAAIGNGVEFKSIEYADDQHELELVGGEHG